MDRTKIYYEFNGKTMGLRDIADKIDVSYNSLWQLMKRNCNDLGRCLKKIEKRKTINRDGKDLVKPPKSEIVNFTMNVLRASMSSDVAIFMKNGILTAVSKKADEGGVRQSTYFGYIRKYRLIGIYRLNQMGTIRAEANELADSLEELNFNDLNIDHIKIWCE